MSYLLGLDIGSSSVKASLVEIATGRCVASDFMPKIEMKISASKAGWAEQDPQMWWDNLVKSIGSVKLYSGVRAEDIKAIGISYQMHGLVCLDRAGEVVRPAIIWCDSRAVPYGQQAFETLGRDYVLPHLLNSPGNFTAAKLAWIKEHEPAIYDRIETIMLPGDYIAYRLSGERNTTVSGLSEGVFWDFCENRVSERLMSYFGFSDSLIPPVVPTFGIQSTVSVAAAKELGLAEGTPIAYRAGDQPNNALSLNVLHAGEIAATAGTSGVVYGVNGTVNYDPLSRVNTFAHVNHTNDCTRLGVLLCINGTGILNSWMKHNVVSVGTSYEEMNRIASEVPIGCDGLSIIPFGNGAERVLQNRETGASLHNLSLTTHSRAHLLRAAQEGIVFSFAYGMEIMQEMGMELNTIKAGRANMFLSPIFRNTLAGVSGATIELYDTDGSIGAARGAGIGARIYADSSEAFESLRRLEVVEPDAAAHEAYRASYERWKGFLQ